MAETLSSLQDLKGATAAPQPEAPHYVQKLDAQGRAYATGKRKDAVARVWIKPGTGKVIVNGRAIEVYFARPVLRMILQQPLGVAKRVDQYDLIVTVAGGGLSGQAGAVRHGLSKALVALRAGSAGRAQEGRFPDPRFARGGAQEIWQEESPPQLPVLEALRVLEFDNQGGLGPPFFVGVAGGGFRAGADSEPPDERKSANILCKLAGMSRLDAVFPERQTRWKHPMGVKAAGRGRELSARALKDAFPRAPLA